ncbi:MAG: diguanylate cyclase [Synechococcaceae cyanobacterium RL_1_2]|nr:diguanylate cyclase [Synechococcaceae cyanobacterium RL_1_2]
MIYPYWVAIEAMHRHGASCTLIKNGSKLVGIVTERDVVRMISSELNLEEFQLQEIMTTDLITLDIHEDINIFHVSKLFTIHRIRHLPVMDSIEQKVIGLLTPGQIRHLMKPEYLLRYIKVSEAMVFQVVQGKPDDSLMHLSKKMNMCRVSCVVIMNPDSQTPMGIVTEKDMVQYRSLGLDFYQVTAQEVMSSPLFTVKGHESLWQVNQKMVELMVWRLVVVNDQGYLSGIVTQTQMLKLLNPAEMHYVMQQMQDVIDQQTVKLQRLNEDLARANSKLEKLAKIDYLTQIANRQGFEEYCHKQWFRAVRLEEEVTIMMVDVDHFKLYNDTYGHPQGDQCLVAIARALQDVASRSSDLVARYGGEEFILVLPNTNREGAKRLAEKILTEVAALNLIHGMSPTANHVTVSIGAASTIPTMALPLDRLIKVADQQLYQAKERSRNTYCLTVVNTDKSHQTQDNLDNYLLLKKP